MASIITIGSTQASGNTRKGGKAVWANRIKGTGNEPLNIGFGVGTPAGTQITAATTDLGLAGEIVSNTGTGGTQSTRITGTSSIATTASGNFQDAYSVTGTITNNISSAIVITEAALFDSNPFPAQTTLNGSTTSGATTITITSASGFPSSGSYDIQIGSEVLTVTAGAGTTSWTVTRGVNGTTGASHANADFVTCVAQTNATTGYGGICVAKGDFGAVTLQPLDQMTLTAAVQFT